MNFSQLQKKSRISLKHKQAATLERWNFHSISNNFLGFAEDKNTKMEKKDE